MGYLLLAQECPKSTSSTLKIALELAGKVTGHEDLAALAEQVQELAPLSDETTIFYVN